MNYRIMKINSGSQMLLEVKCYFSRKFLPLQITRYMVSLIPT